MEVGLHIYIPLAIAVAISIASISYRWMAQQAGWPVGSILDKTVSWPAAVGGITITWCLLKALSLLAWWSPLLLLVAGYFLAFVLTTMLKEKVQYLCVFGCIPAFVLAFVSGVEVVSP